MSKVKILLRQLLYILNRPQRILCILVFIMTCIGSLLECLGVSIIIPVVNVILEPSKIIQSAIVQESDFLCSMSENEIIMGIILGVIFVYLLKNSFFISLSWVRIKFSCKIQRETAIRMMHSYMNRGYQFFLKRNYGELYRGVAEDTISIYSVLYTGFRLISDCLTILLLCIFMIATDWELSLAMIIVSVVCILLIYFVFRKIMHQAGEEYRKYSARSSQAILQAFQGIKDVLILRKQPYFVNEYQKNQVELQKMRCRQIMGQESPAFIIEGVCVAGLMLVIALKTVFGGEQSTEFIASLAAFALAAFRILPSLGRISVSINQVITSMPSINAVYENICEAERYAAEHPEVAFQLQTSNKLIDQGIKEKNDCFKVEEDWSFNNSVELRNISFRYNEEQDYILKNVDLLVKKGQAIAFIGASGAGKSTIVDILLGLLIPQSGTISIDGKSITEQPDLWAKTIGYVPQTVFLSDDSIMGNVAFGENILEVDENRVWKALEQAELSEYVKNLPDGIHTFVGDRGVRLSGGQRQRIAIARALYHRPKILVLDEATSALDNDTEKAIMSAIDSLHGQVTLIIVAHRLSTVKNCDVIYEVCNQGIHTRNKSDLFFYK